MRALVIGIIAGGLSLHAAGSLAGGDAERGAETAKSVCVSCHGEDGVSENPIYPHIGGQYENYLFYSLRAYKTGGRTNAIMQGMVANLSEQDLRDLAAYYSAQRGVLKKAP